jgi:hypothetical protein
MPHTLKFMTTSMNQVLISLEQGDFSRARDLLERAFSAGNYDKSSVIRILLSSAYIHLGRAALFADDPERSLRSFESAQSMGVAGIQTHVLDLMIAEAERCARLGEGRAVIQRWQDMLCLLGEHAPDYMYQRLSDAYVSNRQGFGGTAEENRCWGDCHKYDVLEWLHEKLQPVLYLEIGVDQGLSLARAKGQAIGVDPRPQLDLKVSLPATSQILPLSSDAYFRTIKGSALVPAPGLVFIDGMHLFEFALRDFMNVERHSAPGTLVVIDDIYPCHPVQAVRRRKSGAWAGDIWKLHSVLRELRPDLTLIALNSYTTGLLLIAGLDPDSKVLHERYEDQVRRYKPIEHPPPGVLARHGAIPSAHPVVAEVVEVLAQGTRSGASVCEVQSALFQLRPRIAAAEEEFWGRAQSLAGHYGLERAFTAIGECDVATVFEVYFPQLQKPHYQERASQKLRLSVTGDWTTFSVDIPADTDLAQHSLRIDPAGRVGAVSIEWIRIVDKVSHAVVYRAELPEEFDRLRLSGGFERLANESVFSLYSASSDPQIYLPLLPAAGEDSPGRRLQLQIRIRFNSNSTANAV